MKVVGCPRKLGLIYHSMEKFYVFFLGEFAWWTYCCRWRTGRMFGTIDYASVTWLWKSNRYRIMIQLSFTVIFHKNMLYNGATHYELCGSETPLVCMCFSPLILWGLNKMTHILQTIWKAFLPKHVTNHPLHQCRPRCLMPRLQFTNNVIVSKIPSNH